MDTKDKVLKDEIEFELDLEKPNKQNLKKQEIIKKEEDTNKKSKLKEIDENEKPYTNPLEKCSYEELGLSKKIKVSSHYMKNVLIFLLLILGNQNLSGNLILVSQIQMVYSLWMFLSLLKVHSTNIGFVFQEAFFNVYIMVLIYYFYNSTDMRELSVVIFYFFGLSFSVFFVVFELMFVFVIKPLRKLICRPVPE
jgi:hypothetical protein